MAKVVLVDNLDREDVADVLLKEDISQEEAEELADEYNNAHTEMSPYFARAVEDSYRLWRGIEELI